MSAPGSNKARTATAIDWREIEHNLEAARAATERVWEPAPEEVRRILQERARRLAAVPEQGKAAIEQLEIVEFVLAYERYAVESRYVTEVYPLESLTPLPCTPAFVRGIVNVRGEILAVVDLKKFFDLPEKGLTDLNKVIVLEHDSMRFGILADAIVDVRNIPVAGIQATLPTLTDIRQDYLKGVTPERTVILDAIKLLTDSKLVVREEVAG